MIMYRESEYKSFLARLNDPQNANLKNALSLKPNGYDLTFHIGRIAEYANAMNDVDDVKKQLLELDYGASLTKAKELMDELGWK